MTVNTAEPIGQLLANVVKKEFERAASTAQAEESGGPAIRLSGFESDEIQVIVTALEGWQIPGRQQPIQIVVGSRDLPGLDGYLLPEGKTLTSYRNRNEHGLVLVEVDAQSDEQGLRQMHSIADSDVLGIKAGSDLQTHLRWLQAIAWQHALTEGGLDRPAAFGSELDQLYGWLTPRGGPSLRRWTAYVVACARRLANVGRALAGDEVRTVLAEELGWLGLFPDPRLYERPTSSERRIERNQHLSQLRNPQGKELRDDDLAARVDKTIFLDLEGLALPDDDQDELKRQMRLVHTNGGPSAGTVVELGTWDQLFEKRSKASGIGELVRDFLQQEHPDRLEEYNDLQIDDGLDEGDGEAAELLLTAEPPDDSSPLADLLTTGLRKKVDRLVFRGEQSVEDPLVAVLNGLKALPNEGDDPANRTITLAWERFDKRGAHSARLFGFLYGRTLIDVQEASADSLGSGFEIDPELLDTRSMTTVFDEVRKADEGDDGADEGQGDEWAPLQLALRTSDSKTPLIRFRWSPEDLSGLVLFARLVVAGGAEGQLIGPALDDWADRMLHAWEPLVPIEPLVDHGLTQRWSTSAGDHLGAMATNGISAAAIEEYLDDWSELLGEARQTLVPTGGPLPELNSFLSYETAQTQGDQLVVLGTHPIRLRWLANHLRHLSTFLRTALDGGLQLNSENDQLYFDWLDRVSPHRQPPLVTTSGQLFTAVREVGLHEEYARVARSDEDVPEWLNGVDSASIDEIVSAIRSFVGAFPQKMSGLSVLLLAHTGADRIARQLVEKLRKRELAKLDLELHVVARSADHDAVATALSAFDDEEGRGRSLLPPFRLVLHDWRNEPTTVLDELAGRIDLAVAPNLFGLHSKPLPETRRRESGVGGSFDPWVDAPTYSRPPAPGTINVSQVLLPASPDPVLEAWSTLSVRRHRQQPMSLDDPDGTDFFTLQVQFDRNEPLFSKLHETANWVITLDPFIGREQIDALDDAPDVITVKPGVGKNQMYTLVVSSTAGRQWVTARLASRFEETFGLDPARSSTVAERVYEIGRQVVPGLMLRAVGLGRTIEEILGLILARYALAELEAGTDGNDDGYEYWVSLDEHTDWFGGANRMRPDLLRVRATSNGESTRLDLIVLESKFRQQFDLGAADDQVSRALALLSEALATSDDERDDARFWRRELLSALDQLPQEGADASDLPPIRRLGTTSSQLEIREDVRAGRYTLGTVHGVVGVTAWSGQPAAGHGSTTPRGHRLLAIDSDRARDILERIERRENPFAPRLATPEMPAEPDEPLDENRTGPSPPSNPTVTREHSSDQFERSTAGALPTPSPGSMVDPHPPEPEDEPKLRKVNVAALEGHLQTILDRLDQLNVSVRRPDQTPYQEGPGFCSYRVLPQQGVSAHNVTSKLEDLKLALELPAEMSIRSFVDRGAVVFEVPKEDADRYFVDAAELMARSTDEPDSLSVPIGEDVHGDPVVVDFSSSDTPHLLIAGQTGSGKSVALEAILRGLCEWKSPDELQLVLVDGKGTELVDFEDSPHLLGDIGWLPEDAIEVLDQAVDEMNRRYRNFKEHRVKSLPQYNESVPESERIPWRLVVLDEYADLTSDPDERKQIEASLKRVAQKGRAAGIHLIVATQKPSAEVLSTVIRSNLPAQLALRVKSSTDSRIILDEVGAETLAGKGDAFLKTAKGMTRVQCAMTAISPQGKPL